MSGVDRLHYYENFYDSFCSEFAIPRVHTATSTSLTTSPTTIFPRSSSASNLQTHTLPDPNLKQFTTSSSQRKLIKNQNGNVSNHFYYFDSISDAFTPRKQEAFSRSKIAQQIFNEAENEIVEDDFVESESETESSTAHPDPSCQSKMHFSPEEAHQLEMKKKGPTPPPKPLKLKLLSHREASSPSTSQAPPNSDAVILNPNSGMMDCCERPSMKFLHASFESIVSCPAPPPPKHIQAGYPYTRHMSCEMLPNFSFNPDRDLESQVNRKLSLAPYLQRPHGSPPPPPASQEKKKDSMCLSEFLKLTSNSVFKKPPFLRKDRSSPPFMPCGHFNNGNSTSTSSPTPSNSSDAQNRSSSGPLLTFRKKCGVTKRRKKIDESLFTPTHTSLLAQNNNKTCTPTSTTQSHSEGNAETSRKYSITTAPNNNISPDDHDVPTVFMAETNHDTEFELDPLPEKDCDDVLDFSWAMSSQAQCNNETTAAGVVAAASQAQDESVRRKASNSSNGRPSSRCSLIINTLMGHLNLTKGDGEEQPPNHQYSRDSSNNNNNFFHHHQHHHHNGQTDHFHPEREQKHGTPISKENKKTRHHRKTSQLFSKKKFSDNPNNNAFNKVCEQPRNHNNNNSMNSLPQESDHIVTTSGHSHDHFHHHHQNENKNSSPPTRPSRSRSIMAFNFNSPIENYDKDENEDEGSDRSKLVFPYPPSSSHSNTNNSHSHGPGLGPRRSLSNGHPNNKEDDSYLHTSLNVIGCIPRVSLSHMKCTRSTQNIDEFVENTQSEAKFEIGSLANNPVVSSDVIESGRRETCCGGGLFRGDPQCCDKFDKYYGQYSLTGLNIEQSKSVEQLLLDRYYAHCNKLGEIASPKGGNGSKKKLKKRTYSLPEKIWKNVVPIINSANSNSNNGNSNSPSQRTRKEESYLCGHHKQKQIEECFYCLNEQQTKEKPSVITSTARRKDKSFAHPHPLMATRTRKTKASTEFHELERDFGGNEDDEQLIKFKRRNISNNATLNQTQACRQRTKRDVIQRKQQRDQLKQVEDENDDDEDEDVIGEFSSSSCFSYSGRERGKKSKRKTMKNFVVKNKSCVSSGISCRNTTSEEEDANDDDDDDHLSRDHNFPSEVNVHCIVHNYQDSDDDDDDDEEEENTIILKKTSRRKTCNEDDDDDGIESSGKARKSASKRERKMGSFVFTQGTGNRNNNQGAIALKENGRGEEMMMHSLKLKRNKERLKEGNPIKLQRQERMDPEILIEDGSSSSTISSLPNTSNSDQIEGDNGRSKGALGSDLNPGGEVANTKKARVKWTFLTSGLAKATRRLSGSSRSSSMSSFTTCSSSSTSTSAPGDYGGNGKKESKTSVGGLRGEASKGELGLKGEVKMMTKEAANNKRDTSTSRGNREAKGKSTSRRRNTAEVYLNDQTVRVGITQGNVTNVLRRESHNQKKSKKILRNGSLKRKPSYNLKKKPVSVQVISPPPPFRRRKVEEHKPMPGQPGIFTRKKPIRLPPLSQAGSAPAARAMAMVDSNVFSAFSSSSCNSSTSGSNRSSTSGYTSNVSKKTQKLLKNFRKRWAKKNNKVADGDEEHAYRSQHDNDDTDVDEDIEVHEAHVKALEKPYKSSPLIRSNSSGIVKRRSRVSKHAIFSTFYSGPFLKDPLEEEKIYVTKDFDDVTLDLGSGEVKKTSDGTLLFTADPICFNAKAKLGKKKKRGNAKDLLQRLRKKNKEISDDNLIAPNSSENKKLKKKVEKEVVHKISKRVSASGGLIKSYLGISKKDLREDERTRKNQSAEDVCGGSDDPPNPDTPTRVSSSSGILGRLRDSSRSGFNLGNVSGRNSSKKRGSKQDSMDASLSQTDSPSMQQKNRNSLSDSLSARGDTDDAADQATRRHSHQRSCSSEEELTSINSCENRLSSLTLGSGGSGDNNGDAEYNGPFQGRAVALVDCTPSPYDRHALRYKKGDIIDIISMKRSGLWTGKVNNQVGKFKFINVQLLPENFQRDEDVEDEEDDVDVADDDSAGDYADTSNYQCSIHSGSGGVGEQCTCPNPSARGSQRNDPRLRSSGEEQEYRGNSKRLAGTTLSPWDEQRQSVANVINGYTSGKDKRQMYHSDPLGILNAEEDEEEEEEDDEENDGEDVDVDEEELGNEEEIDDELLEGGRVLSALDKDQRREAEGNQKGFPVERRKKNKRATKKGRPKSVADLLLRLNLDQYTRKLEKHGFESLDLLKELEEEDLDIIGILDGADRTKIITAVELLREWDVDSDRIPGQTLYQKNYYQTVQRTPKPGRALGNVANQQMLHPSGRIIGATGGDGSPAMLHHQQMMGVGGGGGGGIPSPHFYRLHHPRDSGIFVGKVDGEEDVDEHISGADLSCAESHPDVETEEIILSPINLQKSSTGGNNTASGNPSAAWHPHHHHNNNNKQGSHHHINRFISKGAGGPQGVILSGSNNAPSVNNPAGVMQTAQQPTSSASSSGSTSSSSGIATTGDSFWNSNSNGSGSSTGSSTGGAPTTSMEHQNHSQWNKPKTRDHRRDASPAYNTDSVRNRFLQAKSIFDGATNNGPSGQTGKPGHIYENGAGGNNTAMEAAIMESVPQIQSQQHHLHLQRGGSQGKSQTQQQNQQQQQNRFLYCEKSSDSGISVCTNSPPPLRNEFRS